MEYQHTLVDISTDGGRTWREHHVIRIINAYGRPVYKGIHDATHYTYHAALHRTRRAYEQSDPHA